MSGFREHFLDKYFAYRAKYVAHITACAPHRRRWAIASEVARLSFVFLGSAWCATVFGLLLVAAFSRSSPWMWTFGACALLGGFFAAAALLGALQAVRLLLCEKKSRTDARG